MISNRSFAILLVTLLGTACASVPTTVPPHGSPDAASGAATAPLESELPLEPALRHGTLDNGLHYFVRENREPAERAEIWLVVDAGSLQEDEDQLGLAHFVEHMAFNGTERFERQELVDYLETIGMRFGPDVNAYTSFDETVYMLRLPTDDAEIVDQAFRILEDWASAITFDPDEIEKERGVVIEEWRLGRGAEARVRDEQFPVLFHGSRYAERLPIGDVETLQNAPADALVRFWRDWYRPELMTVIAVGDFDGAAIEEKVRHHFEDLTNPRPSRERTAAAVPPHDETLYSIETDPELTSTRVGVYLKLPPEREGTVGAYRRGLVEGLGISMLNARLDELRRGASPPFLGAVSTAGGFVRTADVTAHLARVDPGSVEEGLAALLAEVERAAHHGFAATELERAKADLMRAYERAYREREQRDSGSFAGELLRHTLEEESVPGIEYELGLAQRFLPEISLQEMHDWAATRADGSRVVLVSGPESAAGVLPGAERLAEILRQSTQAELEPWVDRVRDAPLIEVVPAGSPIVEESEIPELGVTEWRLGNGIRVLLKPTDFRDDQVLLSAFSPGGHSLVEDSEWASAILADQVVPAGGLGEFDLTELEKALAGRTARVSPYIDELEEGLSGSASPDDLELLFQLAYLSVTAPRRDPEAFESLLERAGTVLEHRKANPQAVFGDEFTAAVTSGHPRRRPPSVELLDEVELDVAFEVYAERFADLGDLVVVLVGSFDPEAVRPLVETWIGGLPATAAGERWGDVGVERPAGRVEVTVRRGVEPKGLTRVSFGGPTEWSREASHRLQSLAAALRIRLREVLREDLGGTYGVRVSSSMSPHPDGRYTLDVSFGSDPERADELRSALFAELAKVIESGFTDATITKVKELQRRERETALEENGFWAGALVAVTRYGIDPLEILTFDDLVDSLDADVLRGAAERYIDLDNYVAGSLKPESPEAE